MMQKCENDIWTQIDTQHDTLGLTLMRTQTPVLVGSERPRLALFENLDWTIALHYVKYNFPRWEVIFNATQRNEKF